MATDEKVNVKATPSHLQPPKSVRKRCLIKGWPSPTYTLSKGDITFIDGIAHLPEGLVVVRWQHDTPPAVTEAARTLIEGVQGDAATDQHENAEHETKARMARLRTPAPGGGGEIDTFDDPVPVDMCPCEVDLG